MRAFPGSAPGYCGAKELRVVFDLAIVGGGLVGASLARAARGLSVALVASEVRSPSLPAQAAFDARMQAGFDARMQAGFDARIYAITPGNAAFLRDARVWQSIPEARLTPVYAMRVYGDDGDSTLEFDALRAGVSELAWIVEDGALQGALWNALQAREGLEIFEGAACAALDIGPENAVLRLRDDRVLHAKLVVGADGAQSFVRAQAGIPVTARTYGQTAVVANFACARAHRNIAYQWFQGGPVLALLPLPGDHVSMVWSTRDADAARLLALDATALCREVEAASRGVLGALSIVTVPRGFALRRARAQRMVAPRVALAGDAAHVVHPLAGQGANLGLQDARELAAVLAGREPGRDPGDLRLLRRYARARAEPIMAMGAAVDGLYRLFGVGHGAVARLRNAGLNLTDRLPVLKNMLARHAAG